MCGIAGIWNTPSGDENAPQRLHQMLKAQEHRGPDGAGHFSFQGGAAGMVRLALVDLSDRGQQPLYAQDKHVAILFNGEVYNFREERRRLESKGYTFQTTTDTEVVLALYLEHGPSFVTFLRGMFAIAIFDWRRCGREAKPDLLLARDPFGIKPLYLYESAGKPLIFGSEIRSLLASDWIPKQIDTNGLESFLCHGYALEPHTLIRDVRMMAPGTMERFLSDGSHFSEHYYSVPAYAPRTESFSEAAARLRTVLEESVSLHAFADAPVGAFLSGGVDSTGVVALMRPHIADLHTFTIHFPDLPDTDESHLAEEVAKNLQCNHHTAKVVSSEVPQLLVQFAHQIDQPSADGFNTWLISKAASEHVKGVLSGLGGDEWFAGYPLARRASSLNFNVRGKLLKPLAHTAARMDHFVPTRRLRRRAQNLSARRSMTSLWLHAHRLLHHHTVSRLLQRTASDHYESRFQDAVTRTFPQWGQETDLGAMCLLDSRYYMGSQLLRDSDAASMAHSLELRVPLVDREIVNFSRTCSDAYKLKKGGGEGLQYGQSGSKAVLIQALDQLLPSQIHDRPKRGFSLPYPQWLRSSLKPITEDTLSPESVRARGLFDTEAFLNAVQETTLSPGLWGLVVFELWCRSVIDS